MAHKVGEATFNTTRFEEKDNQFSLTPRNSSKSYKAPVLGPPNYAQTLSPSENIHTAARNEGMGGQAGGTMYG